MSSILLFCTMLGRELGIEVHRVQLCLADGIRDLLWLCWLAVACISRSKLP